MKPDRKLWRGRGISGLAVLFLLFDAVIKVIRIDPVVESFAQLGYPVSIARGIGILELFCVALYLIPRTSVTGVVLLTGYLGGAVATHVRVGSPLFSHVLFPFYIGAMLWIGLCLRDDRLRALVPLSRSPHLVRQ
jgi:DoxX-like family